MWRNLRLAVLIGLACAGAACLLLIPLSVVCNPSVNVQHKRGSMTVYAVSGSAGITSVTFRNIRSTSAWHAGAPWYDSTMFDQRMALIGFSLTTFSDTTYSGWILMFPLWMPAVALGLWPAVAFWQHHRRRKSRGFDVEISAANPN